MADATGTTPVLHTIDDVAKWIGIHRKTVEKLIRTGELGYVKVGSRKVVRDDQLAAYIDAHTVDTEQ